MTILPVYIVQQARTYYVQGSQENLHYEKIVDRLEIETVAVIMVVLNTHGFRCGYRNPSVNYE